MKHKKSVLPLVIVTFGLLLFASACEKLGHYIDPHSRSDTKGYVYTSSNDPAKNSIMIFKQDADGLLSYKTTVQSGGTGTGMSLGSQGAIIVDHNNKWLYAVNAGDNTISSFRIMKDGSLALNQTINSGGIMPVSLTVLKSLLYVVNNSGNICGFKIHSNGELMKIPKSEQPLSSPTAMPAEILFHPNGTQIVVTEKATNKILTFQMNGDVPMPPVIHPANAATPFGFTFAGNSTLIVTNAAGGAAGASRVTSFTVDNAGMVIPKSNIATGQAAVCWIEKTKDNQFAFVTNTGSNSISSFRIFPDGTLEFLDPVAAETGNAPTDVVRSGFGEYLYNVNEKSGTIGEYRIHPHGKLQYLGQVPGLTTFAAGLAAF